MNNELPSFLINPIPELYLTNNYLVFDFETTTIGKGLAVYPQNKIVSVAWKRFGEKTYYKRAGEYEQHELLNAIRTSDFVVCHNAKFDLQWAERCGLDLTNVLVYDTLLGEYVLGGNRWMYGKLALDVIARKRFGEGKTEAVSAMIKAGIDTADIPETWLEKYCKQDVELTERIFLEQRKELHELGLLPVQYNRCLLTPVLAEIEKNGLQLDSEMVVAKCLELEKEYAEIGNELEKITGGINVNSRTQLAEYLYTTLGFEQKRVRRNRKWVVDTTPGGAPKTDADTIAALTASTARQKEFLATYVRSQELNSELTKYLRKFNDCCRESGGRLHAVFNQTNTQTHRLSSTGLDYSAQFQNFPRAYKPLFRARTPGWLVGEADGAQLEFRVAVHLGRDKVGLDDIVGGTDIHSVTAGVIGCTRQEAKPHTFKPLYGGRSGTPDEVRYYQFFREKYKGIADTQQRWIDAVLDKKYLVTEWGLRYYWPDTRMDDNGYVTNTTAICNYPVQAFATAEIIPLALVFFWHRLKRSGCRMFVVNTVHDSIIVELPPEEIDAFHELSRLSLIDDCYSILKHLYGIAFSVPLGAGIKIATHWGGSDASSFVPAGMVHDKGEVIYTAEEKYWAGHL